MPVSVEILPKPGCLSLVRGFLGTGNIVTVEGVVRVRNTTPLPKPLQAKGTSSASVSANAPSSTTPGASASTSSVSLTTPNAGSAASLPGSDLLPPFLSVAQEGPLGSGEDYVDVDISSEVQPTSFAVNAPTTTTAVSNAIDTNKTRPPPKRPRSIPPQTPAGVRTVTQLIIRLKGRSETCVVTRPIIGGKPSTTKVVNTDGRVLLDQGLTLIGHPTADAPFYAPDEDADGLRSTPRASPAVTPSNSMSNEANGTAANDGQSTNNRSGGAPVIIATGGLILQAGEYRDFDFSFQLDAEDQYPRPPKRLNIPDGRVTTHEDAVRILPTTRISRDPTKEHYGLIEYQVRAECAYSHDLDGSVAAAANGAGNGANNILGTRRLTSFRERLFLFTLGRFRVSEVARDLDFVYVNPAWLAVLVHSMEPFLPPGVLSPQSSDLPDLTGRKIVTSMFGQPCRRHWGFTWTSSWTSSALPPCTCKYRNSMIAFGTDRHAEEEGEAGGAISSQYFVRHVHPLLSYSISTNRRVLSPGESFDLTFRIAPRFADSDEDGAWVTIASLQVSLIERQKIEARNRGIKDSLVHAVEEDVEVLRWERREGVRGEFQEERKVSIPIPPGPPTSAHSAKRFTPSTAANGTISPQRSATSLPPILPKPNSATSIPTTKGTQRMAPVAMPHPMIQSFSMSDSASESGQLTIFSHVNPSGEFDVVGFSHYLKAKITFVTNTHPPESSTRDDEVERFEQAPTTNGDGHKQSDGGEAPQSRGNSIHQASGGYQSAISRGSHAERGTVSSATHTLMSEPQSIGVVQHFYRGHISNTPTTIELTLPLYILRRPADRLQCDRIIWEDRAEIDARDREFVERRAEVDPVWQELVLGGKQSPSASDEDIGGGYDDGTWAGESSHTWRRMSSRGGAPYDTGSSEESQYEREDTEDEFAGENPQTEATRRSSDEGRRMSFSNVLSYQGSAIDDLDEGTSRSAMVETDYDEFDRELRKSEDLSSTLEGDLVIDRRTYDAGIDDMMADIMSGQRPNALLQMDGSALIDGTFDVAKTDTQPYDDDDGDLGSSDSLDKIVVARLEDVEISLDDEEIELGD
ncbi:hypothetical protein BJ742DRAFT_806705 [Cladochytrium replicatum]|nr:hypothetical protein BJ742DRAFT_806705 [Cladochytrium replicatum]